MSKISINTEEKIDEVEQKILLTTCVVQKYVDIIGLPHLFFWFSPTKCSKNSIPSFIDPLDNHISLINTKQFDSLRQIRGIITKQELNYHKSAGWCQNRDEAWTFTSSVRAYCCKPLQPQFHPSRAELAQDGWNGCCDFSLWQYALTEEIQVQAPSLY